MEDIFITLIQSNIIWEDKISNLANIGHLIDRIKETTDIIVLPEMFTTGFTMNPGSYAEETEGMTIGWMREKARERKCVIAGSLIIKEGINYYNRLIWMDSHGNYRKYDKRHLFRLGNENEHYTSGREKLIVELKGWRIMPLICYDLRFPVWSKNRIRYKTSEEAEEKAKEIGVEYEYDCLIYTANWPAARIYAWKSLIIGRAIENMSYVVGLNRTGEDGKGIAHSGESMAVDYKGKIIAELGRNKEEMQTVRLSKEELLEFRKKFSFGLDWDDFIIK